MSSTPMDHPRFFASKLPRQGHRLTMDGGIALALVSSTFLGDFEAVCAR